MSANDNSNVGHESERLAFMLSQLSSDLTDLAASLEDGTLDHASAAQGARLQLEWALSQLSLPTAPKE